MNRDLHKSSGRSPSGFNKNSRGCSGAEPVVRGHNNFHRPCRGRINHANSDTSVLFNPSGVVDFIFSMTTGSGLSAYTRGYCYNDPYGVKARQR